jgi:uncharacterized phiE125 gp8 family phage protein
MDQWLPVDPASVYGAGLYGPRFWRDILHSDPIELSTEGDEPIALEDVKHQCRIDASITEFDPWFDLHIPIARRKVQRDTGYALVPTAWEMTFDRYPLERWIVLPYPPLTSITALFSTDIFGVETTVDPATYYADTHMAPGRLILQPAVVWPTGTRNEQGGRVQWVSGFATAAAIPQPWILAQLLLLTQWFEIRGAAARPRLDPTDLIPLGYDECLGDRRVGIG